MKVGLLSTLALAALFAGCSDDSSSGGSGDGNGNGNGNGNTGPAFQVDAQVDGGSTSGDISGESETASQGDAGAPNTYYASFADGLLTVSLASSDATIIMFTLHVDGEMSGDFGLGQDVAGNYLSITRSTGTIQESTGGSVHISVCPEGGQGDTISGTFNNVGLFNAITSAEDGTLSGSWQAKMVLVNGTITCPPPPDDGGTATDTGGMFPAGSSCDLGACNGPCCPFVTELNSCVRACAPTDFGCPFTCVTSSGMMTDPVCSPLLGAINQCGETNGCNAIEDEDASDACFADNCCAEGQAAF